MGETLGVGATVIVGLGTEVGAIVALGIFVGEGLIGVIVGEGEMVGVKVTAGVALGVTDGVPSGSVEDILFCG